MHNLRLKIFTLGGFAVFTSLLLIASGTAIAADPVWSTPPKILANTRVPNADGASLTGQQVVINAKGQVVSAWVKGTDEVQARVRLNNVWGNPITLVPAASG